MGSIISRNENETTPYYFVSKHMEGCCRGKNKRQFSGSWFCDPGPSFARCQPIKNMPSIDVDWSTNASTVIAEEIIFKIITMAYREADCSVGIHTNVDQYFDRNKSRIGYEISVHGHRINVKENGCKEWRESRWPEESNLQEVKYRSENAKDWLDKEWADGDVIKLAYSSDGKLIWWWNGIVQSCIDVSEENNRIASETLNQGPKSPVSDIWGNDIELFPPKWCFYVRGVRMNIRILKRDLNEKEYAKLRTSYADRLKVMNEKIDEAGSDTDI